MNEAIQIVGGCVIVFGLIALAIDHFTKKDKHITH